MAKVYIKFVWDSAVGIANRYGLNGLEIESQWEQGILYPSRPALGPSQPPIQWVWGLFPGVKRPGRGVGHTPPFSTEVIKERVEPYLYLVACCRVDCTFTL